MLTIVAQGHAAQQFDLNLGADRPLDPNRERLEVPGIVDLNPAAGPDDADDHARALTRSRAAGNTSHAKGMARGPDAKEVTALSQGRLSPGKDLRCLLHHPP
jgi:hypothetical protein